MRFPAFSCRVDPAIFRVGILIFLALASLSRSLAQVWLNPDITRIDHLGNESLNELRTLPEDCVVQTPVHAGFHSGFAPSSDSVRWVQIDLGADYPVDGVVVVPATLGNETPYGFPIRFRIDAARDPLMSEAETLIEASEVGEPLGHSSVYPRYADGKRTEARYIRFTALSLVPEPRQKLKFIFCLGEILVFSRGGNVALGGTVLAPASAETSPTWAASYLVDGCHAMGISSVATSRAFNGWHSAIFKTPRQNCWVQVDFGEAKPISGIRLIPAPPCHRIPSEFARQTFRKSDECCKDCSRSRRVSLLKSGFGGSQSHSDGFASDEGQIQEQTHRRSRRGWHPRKQAGYARSFPHLASVRKAPLTDREPPAFDAIL